MENNYSTDDEKEGLLEMVSLVCDEDGYSTRHRFVDKKFKFTLFFYNFRVILVGGGGVGKTSLQEKFLSPENSQFYESVYGNHLFTFIQIVYVYRIYAFQEIRKNAKSHAIFELGNLCPRSRC